jgi:starch synthase
MTKKRVLIVTQEMQPFTVLSEISEITSKLPQYIQDQGMEIRVLMPRYGSINERRHRLHEVVRLSGMNIIVDDDDYPLIIKVASLPGARMQVYFLDNDEFFKRKSELNNDNGDPYEDNAEGMIFFCKGAIEIVKKFGWSPDIVHCHGWMTSLIPFYLKTAYKNEPIFKNSKVVYSLYNFKADQTFSDRFSEKAAINNLESKDLLAFQNGSGISVHKGAVSFADALISNADFNDEYIKEILKNSEKPYLEVGNTSENLDVYTTFYEELDSIGV